MSDIITTLHPENDESTNLYPNIIKENIPKKAINRDKLDDNINELLNNIGKLNPAGVDTSAHILAFTINKGIYIGSDTGNWYYWNGTQYVSGGTYLSALNVVSHNNNQLLDENGNDLNPISYISPSEILKTITYTKTDGRAIDGYYVNNTLTPSTNIKCIKLEIDDNCYISFNVTTQPALNIAYLEFKDGSFVTLGKTTRTNIPLYNVKYVYFNFFGDEYSSGFTLTYINNLNVKTIKNNNISLNNIVDTYTYNENNCNCEVGYYGNTLNITRSVGATCCKIPLNGKTTYLTFTTANTPAVGIGYIQKNDDTIVGIGTSSVTNMEITDAKYLCFNFFGSNYATEFTLRVKTTDNDELKYYDYTLSNYNFENKKLLFVGDSITKGFTSGSTQTPNGYPKLFSDYVGAEFTNNALGGALYASGYNEIKTLLGQLTDTTNKNTYDYVFIAGGTNDYSLNVVESDFKQAVEYTIDYALSNFTNAHIIIITPINKGSVASNVLSLQDYRNIITEIAITKDVDTNNKITVIQGNFFDIYFNKSSNDFKTLLVPDGTHPSESGYKVYTRGLIKALCR